MIGCIVFSTLMLVLIGRTIVKDRKDYYDWYNQYNHTLKR